MKTKKFILKTIALLAIINSFIYSDGSELNIYNGSTHNDTVSFMIYPVSMVFNKDFQYNLLASVQRNENSYINGRGINALSWVLNPNEVKTFEFDRASQPTNGSVGTISYGKYRIDVWYDDVISGPPDDYVMIEYDYLHGIPAPQYATDLNITIKEDANNNLNIYYGWLQYSIMPEVVLIPENRLIEGWHQSYPNHWREKNFGDFHYDFGNSSTSNNYDIMPQDPRRDCVPEVYSQYPYQNHLFNYAYTINFIDYYSPASIGVLTLKLTIEKDISTPNYLSRQFGTYPCVLPSPIVITNGASLILSTDAGSERTFEFKTVENETFGTNLNVDGNGKFELLGTTNSGNKAHVTFNSYCNSTFDAGSILNLGQNSKITLTGNTLMTWAHWTQVNAGPGTVIELFQNSRLNNCGATINGLGNLTFIGDLSHIIYNPDACNWSNNGLPIENHITNCSYELSNGSTLTLGNNCVFIFDGPETHIKADPGTSIILGDGASLQFINGAYLESNGCTFTSINSGEIWNGIVLDGAGSQTSIQNCTFNDAATSISVTNTVCNISGNTFNISNNTNCVYGINAVNESNITISSNTFNAGSNPVAECIKFFNYDGDGLPGGGGIPAYSLNIFNNVFNGGVYPIDIQCLTASQLPFYISYNQFYPEGGITANGIFAYNITGNVKNNVFYNSHSDKAVSLQFSSVNLYNNTLQSAYQNIWSNNSTVMQMAPIQNEFGQWVWYGGYNKLTSTDNYNIEFRGYSNPIVSPNGLNCFNVSTQPNFIGEICLGSKPYRAYDNYWSPTPTSSTFNITCNNNPVNVTYSPNLTYCPDIDPGDIVGSYVSSLGNSLYDTVFVTSSGGLGGSQSSNENTIKKSSNTTDILYFESIQKRNVRDYAGAINKCKELINDHDTSSYFNSALSELYLNYLQSDTSGNQTITNGLFSNLKTYLEQKMQQYTNNTQFIEKAYKYLLMCLVKTKNYSEAIAGYENIMNNHPDPIVRLNASWDRSAVVFMMGEGGSNNDLNNSTNKSRNKKLLDKNPAHKIAENIFKDQKEESKRIEKNNELYNVDAVNTVKYTKQEKAEIERRIENYNPTDKKDFMAKLSSDIKLLEVINTSKVTKKVNNNLPKAFKLLQNYPNPFNPVTNIKYEIPKDAFIILKVYDLLGKEVFSINEFKKAGSYEVKFDGRNLASGMYFYSLESSGYKDTKKMVLIK